MEKLRGVSARERPALTVFVCTPESESRDEIGETNRLLSEICAEFDSEPFPVLLAGLLLLKYGGKVALLNMCREVGYVDKSRS